MGTYVNDEWNIISHGVVELLGYRELLYRICTHRTRIHNYAYVVAAELFAELT